jgi:hypothetical protein
MIEQINEKSISPIRDLAEHDQVRHFTATSPERITNALKSQSVTKK